MAKLLKRLLALGVAAMLLFACAACNGNKQPEPTEPEFSEELTSEPETLDAAVTDTTEETTEETSEGETTTEAETTTGVPKGKAEIIKYVNEVMNKVRETKPGYSFTEITHIDDKSITSSNGAIRTIAKGAVSISKGIWSKWTDPKVKKAGDDHDGVAPKVDLTSSMVKSASCNDSGGVYTIRISLVDERAPVLPEKESDLMHGRVISAMTKSQIEDGAGNIPGLTINKCDILYTGSYIQMTVNKATGLPTKIIAYVSEVMSLEAKLGFTVDAGIPIANERVYTF